MAIKVLIVDDSVLARRLISSALEQEAALQVVGTAVNGANALKKIEFLDPDVVIMDVEMPEMDGLEALKHIKLRYPHIAVIMFSSLSETVTEKTVMALEAGAEDFVAKPTGTNGIEEVKMLTNSSLVPKILALKGELKSRKSAVSEKPLVKKPVSASIKPSLVENKILSSPPESSFKARISTNKLRNSIKALVIGVSTGGPNALAKLIPAIPASIPVPVFIVQHMPASFTKTLARRLDASSDLTVKEAHAGELATPGTAWIAPGGYHMVLNSLPQGVTIQLNEDPPEQGCRPAVDVLFRSAAEIYGKHTLAIILTGMGKDGLNGSKAIVESGGSLFAQDEASSVVWGMPGAVTRAGLADKVIPLDRMGYEIMLRIETAMTKTYSH